MVLTLRRQHAAHVANTLTYTSMSCVFACTIDKWHHTAGQAKVGPPSCFASLQRLRLAYLHLHRMVCMPLTPALVCTIADT